jgi:HSP20 family protein
MRYPGLACCPVRARGKSRRLRYGRFEYRVLLPGHAKADTVTAALADGVLTVTVPKAEADKPRCIEITAG